MGAEAVVHDRLVVADACRRRPSCRNSIPAAAIPNPLNAVPYFIGHLTLPDAPECPGELRVLPRLLLYTFDERVPVNPKQVFYRACGQDAKKWFSPGVSDRCEDALPSMLCMLSNNPVELIEPDEFAILFSLVGRIAYPPRPQEPLFNGPVHW
jgi:hypothetical protein